MQQKLIQVFTNFSLSIIQTYTRKNIFHLKHLSLLIFFIFYSTHLLLKLYMNEKNAKKKNVV